MNKKECVLGNHVPVAGLDKHNRILDIYCQNCLIPMTKEQFKRYFGNKYDSKVNYDNPGDPNDVDVFCDSGS